MAATEYVLSDDMLRGFAERCGAYDRENRFFQEDFDDLKRAGYLTMAVPKELGGRGMTLAQVLSRAAPARLPRARHGARHQHARLLGRTGRRSLAPGRSLARVAAEGGDGGRGVQRRPLRARQRPSRPALHQQGRAGGRRLPHHRPQDVRQPGARSGRATACTRPGRMPMAGRRSCTPSCRAATTAIASSRPGTRWACARRAATTWCWRAPSCPDKYIARIVPAGGADAFVLGIFAWASARLRQHLLRRRAACDGPGTAGAEDQDLARGEPLDGLPPGNPARGGRDGAGVRSDRAAPREGGRGLVERRGPRRRPGRRRSSRPSTTRSRPAGGSSTSRWRYPAAPACSAPTSWSGCSATPAAAVSTRRTPSWCTRSSPRPPSASTSASSRAGARSREA